MDLLNVMDHQSVRLWLAQSIAIFFLIGGFVLLGVGIGLIVNSAASLQLFGRMNQWVSLRRVTRPMEIPRDTRQAVLKYRHWLAAIFIAGGAFATYGLILQYDAAAAISLFQLGWLRPDFAGWVVDSARLLLIIGNLLAIVAGAMLIFFPNVLESIEAAGSTWFSERKASHGADTMRRLKLDDWVSTYPRPAGATIIFFALILIGAFGLLLPGLW